MCVRVEYKRWENKKRKTRRAHCSRASSRVHSDSLCDVGKLRSAPFECPYCSFSPIKLVEREGKAVAKDEEIFETRVRSAGEREEQP